MIYTPEVAFIHVPKTGGMSVTRFLVNALDDPVTVVAPANARAHSLNMAKTPQAAAKLTHVEGRRHETCPEAVALIRAQGWGMPGFAFAMIRDPVDLMLSYYKHMRKPDVWKRLGLTLETLTGAPRAAIRHTFDEFCRRRRYYNMSDDDIMTYFRPSGFVRLDIVPLPEIGGYLAQRFSHHAAFASQALEHRNRSTEQISLADVAPATRDHIRATYPELTRLYEEVITNQAWKQQ